MTLLLVVDDSADLRSLLSEQLEEQKYFVISTSDGQRALQLMQNHKVTPDVIILDMMMPNMNGAEFLKKKRKDPSLAGIPVILCTGLSSEEVRHDCAEDVLLVVRKPYVVADFLKVLGHLRRTGSYASFKSEPPPPT